MPFGGKYRVIDFTLSNCINSGIRKIQYKSHSLVEHRRDAWNILSPEMVCVASFSSENPMVNLYDKKWPIRTYQGQYPPAKTVFADEDDGRAGKALDSIICSGVIISGGKIVKLALSPDVRVNSYVEVSESMLFRNVVVGMKAKVKKAIIDKGVRIPSGMKIGYDLDKDRERFYVSDEGIVVIPRKEKRSKLPFSFFPFQHRIGKRQKTVFIA